MALPSIAAAAPLIAAPLAALAVLAQAAPEPEHRFDVRTLELLARANREDFDARTPLESPFLGMFEADDRRLDLTLDDDSGDVAQLWIRGVFELATHFHGAPVDGVVDGHELVVRGGLPARSAVERALWAVERWLGRAWSVELAELPPGALDALPSAVLSAAEVDALLRVHTPIITTQRIATTRRAARFPRERPSSVLSDLDAMVTRAGNCATDPVVYVVRWGTDAVVWLAPHVDGRVLVSCAWRRGEPLGDPRPVHVYGPESPPIELAQGAGCRRIGSAWLADGGALVLAQDGEHARGPVLVRLRALPMPAATVDDIGFFGLGAVARVRFDTHSAAVHEASPTKEAEEPDESLAPQPEQDDAMASALDAQVQAVTALLEELRDHWSSVERPPAAVRLGNELIVAGAPAVLAETRAALLRRLAPDARTFVFEVRYGTLPHGAPAGLAVGAELDATSPVPAALDARFLGAAALGDPLELTSVRQWVYLGDVPHNVGDDFELGSPIMRVVEACEALHCRALARPDGLLSLGLRLHRRDTPPPPFSTTEATSLRRVKDDVPSVLTTEIERPISEPADLALDTTVTLGRWTVLAIEAASKPAGAVRVLVAKVSESR